jgi:hypothetical protein
MKIEDKISSEIVIFMKLFSIILLCLLLPFDTFSFTVEDYDIRFRVYDEPNNAVLIIDSSKGVEGSSYYIKVNQTCYEENVNLIKIQSKDMNQNFSFTSSCYGDFYELAPADNVELKMFIEYINSHSKVKLGNFEFKFNGYQLWIQELQQGIDIPDRINAEEENLESQYSQGWRDAEKQLRSSVYLEGWDEGQKQLSNKRYTEVVKVGEAQISSEKDLIMLMLIFSLIIHFITYTTNKKRDNLDNISQGQQEKRITELKNKLDIANNTIKKSNQSGKS